MRSPWAPALLVLAFGCAKEPERAMSRPVPPPLMSSTTSAAEVPKPPVPLKALLDANDLERQLWAIDAPLAAGCGHEGKPVREVMAIMTRNASNRSISCGDGDDERPCQLSYILFDGHESGVIFGFRITRDDRVVPSSVTCAAIP